MLLRSTTKLPILGVLTNNHISEAFRIEFVNKSMLLRSKTKPPFFRGEIMIIRGILFISNTLYYYEYSVLLIIAISVRTLISFVLTGVRWAQEHRGLLRHHEGGAREAAQHSMTQIVYTMRILYYTITWYNPLRSSTTRTKPNPHNPRPYDIFCFSWVLGLALGCAHDLSVVNGTRQPTNRHIWHRNAE